MNRKNHLAGFAVLALGPSSLGVQTRQRPELIRDESVEIFQALKHFLPRCMLSTLRTSCKGEEKDFFIDMLRSLASRIKGMPPPYGTRDQGDAIVWLHYFTPNGDWYVTEKDSSAEQHQAFGLVDLYHDGGDLGYISIAEMLGHPLVNLDLYWTPKPLRDVRTKK